MTVETQFIGERFNSCFKFFQTFKNDGYNNFMETRKDGFLFLGKFSLLTFHNREDICLQTIFLLFKCANHENKRPLFNRSISLWLAI